LPRLDDIQDMSRIPLIYHTNIKFYTQYTHPTLICRGTDAHTDGRTENIYSIFKDKLLLLGEHVHKRKYIDCIEPFFEEIIPQAATLRQGVLYIYSCVFLNAYFIKQKEQE
jgi:hypothetical protein